MRFQTRRAAGTVGVLGGLALTWLLGCSSTSDVESTPKKAPASEPSKNMVKEDHPKESSAGAQAMGEQERDGFVTNSRAFPTGDTSTSAVLVEKRAPAEVIAGQAYVYEIKVTNLTNHRLEQVVVRDDLGDGFAIANASPAAQSTDDGVAQWALGELAPKDARTIRVDAMAKNPGSVTNCATVSYLDVLCLTTRVVQPAISITKSGPAEVLACDPITYSFVVANNGTGVARNVKIEDRLPEGLTSDAGGNSIVLSVPELGAGEQRELTATVRAARTGTFSNAATATADGGLSAESETVETAVRQPVLELAMNCGERVFGGQRITYRIAVSNTGDAPAADTRVEASIPPGTAFVSASSGGAESGGRVTWNVGAVPAGDARNLEFVVRADELGSKASTARANGVCAEAVETTCETRVEGIPAILLEVIDEEDPIPVGSDVTYEITVTNQGSADAIDVTLVCELEPTMEYVTSEGATRGSASNRTISFAPLPRLAPKARATWRLTVKALEAADARFKVSMTESRLERPVQETEATNFYE